MNQKGLVPKRRFDGFTRNWEKQTLDKVLDLLKDGTHGTHKNVKDGIYLLSAKNIKHGKVNIDKSDRRISMDEYRAIHRNFELKKGDVLLTVVGSIGESAILKQENKFTFQRSVAYLRPTEKITSQYLFSIVNSIYFQNELKDRQVVSAQPGIYLGSLSEIPIYFPTLKEQQKIGQFFKHLDDMIALQQKKIDKTKALKSAYLAEMFPAEGECVPKRRFAGFTDDWKEQTLGDLGSVAMNKRIFKEQTSETGEVPFYKIGTFGRVPDAFISYELFNEYKSKYQYPNIGDILISASGSIGRTVEYMGDEEYFQDSNIVWLKHDGRIDNKFLKQFYSIVKWQGLEGSTITRLYNSNILNTKISVPSLAEQQKIGDFFMKIDETITNHQRILEKLKATKQAYLNEMFV